MLTRNRMKCLKCQKTIESKHRHDFVVCSCGDLFVDGGTEYQRFGFKDMNDVEDLCEWSNDGQAPV